MEEFTLYIIEKLERFNSEETKKHSIDCNLFFNLLEDQLVKEDYFDLSKYRVDIIRNGFLIHDIGNGKIGIDYSEVIERGTEKWKLKSPVFGHD